jgi:hypothetical protein
MEVASIEVPRARGALRRVHRPRGTHLLEEVIHTFRPRVLDVRLASEPGRELSATRCSWREGDPVIDAAGRLGGAALALTLCLAAARRGDEELPLVIAVGDAVRRGLPTAARATVAAVAPL